MRKVVNGKVFDTEKAEQIGYWANNLGPRDFRDLSETLYRSPKGTFFLHGEGGAMTAWSEACGDMRGAGQGITVLTTEEAREWCENHRVPVKVIEKEFTVEEG